MLSHGILLASILVIAHAQFPPKPRGLTVLKSKFHENITISYKEPRICETTPGVKSYSGYVHLPPGTLDGDGTEIQNYPINTFFWFFEARKAPEHAPLSIWLNGGPGASSFIGLLQELGPCFITSDSKGTYLNGWSWSNEVNMLFIDQPNQAGFSYDVLTNGTLMAFDDDELDGAYMKPIIQNFTDERPLANLTAYPGTFASQEVSATQNSTASAARALWHFAQTWFFEFPGYKPKDNRISLWTESYGGHYGPGVFRFFQEQNNKISNGILNAEQAHYLHLDTLGIINGQVDLVVQGDVLPDFAYNNTYGIQIFNETQYHGFKDVWFRPDGCREQLLICQDALEERDGALAAANAVIHNVSEVCGRAGECILLAADRYGFPGMLSYYDIGHPVADPFPPPQMLGYLTQESTLAALGVPVNFSSSSFAVSTAFNNNFDMIRGGFIKAIGFLLDSGVKVHMLYGDRDFFCNWVGGEKVSLAVPYSRSHDFARAGYSPFVTHLGIGGMTRQLGNFSFTRVFQAGHEVPAYQPVVAYEIFMRAMRNRDIATGKLPVTDNLSTVGPRDTWFIKNTPPEKPKPRCYILRPLSCPPEIWRAVVKGTAEVKDWFVMEDNW